MQRFTLSYILSAGLVVLLLFGCAEENLVNPVKDDGIDVFLINSGPVPEPTAGKFFTGRDSFGVALKATVTGSVTSAQGTATHMGKIIAEHSHHFDPVTLALTDGAFTYRGTNGALLSGRYEGTLEPTPDEGVYTIQGRLWVEEGTVKATNLPAEGRGTIEGTLYPDGSFTYKLEGWLLHHVAE